MCVKIFPFHCHWKYRYRLRRTGDRHNQVNRCQEGSSDIFLNYSCCRPACQARSRPPDIRTWMNHHWKYWRFRFFEFWEVIAQTMGQQEIHKNLNCNWFCKRLTKINCFPLNSSWFSMEVSSQVISLLLIFFWSWSQVSIHLYWSLCEVNCRWRTKRQFIGAVLEHGLEGLLSRCINQC